MRESIRRRGYEVEDMPSGTRWRRVPGRKTRDGEEYLATRSLLINHDHGWWFQPNQ